MNKLIYSKRFCISFISSITFMLITHLYIFTNLTLNNDSANFGMTGESFEHCISFGRWFQWIAGSITPDGVPPIVYGFLSVFFISISVYLLLIIFHIEKPILIVCFSALFCSFPVLACDFLYWYNADTTWLSLLLSVFSVFLLAKYRWKYFAAAILLLTLSTGIYQVFWSFAAGLLFVVFLWELLLSNSIKDSFKRGFLYLSTLICSITCYALITKLLQWITEIPASSYMGLDQAGRFGSIRDIYWTLRDTYISFFSFYFTKRVFTLNFLIILLNVICFTLIIITFFFILYKRKMGRIYNFIVFVFFLFSPLAINNLGFISRNRMHEVNMIAFIIPYCLLIALLNYLSCTTSTKYSLNAGIISIILLSYFYYLTSNQIYMRTQLNYEITYGYLNRMVMRIEEYPGYTDSMPVYLLNENEYSGGHIEFLQKDYPHEIDDVFLSLDNNISILNKNTFVTNTRDIKDFINFYLGMNMNIVLEGSEIDRIRSLIEFEKMELYPNFGGMQIIDNSIVIKLPD